MNTTDKNLQTKIDALDCLLAAPCPDDDRWFDQVLTALEQVTEFALDPGLPVRALSRAA
jgi:hypothetical protein